MGFGDEVAAWAERTMQREQEVFAGVKAETFRSIVEGSEITGSPGQPVISGGMKESWGMVDSGDRATISTNHPGAPAIEFDTRHGRSLVIHSPVGGSHSLQLTKDNFQAIVDHVVENAGGYGAIGVAEGEVAPFRTRQLYTKRLRRNRRYTAQQWREWHHKGSR